MLAELRRARYGYLLALHILLLCAAQRTPTEIAAVLFCSRSTVYRVVAAYRAGQWDELGEEEETDSARPYRRVSVLSPALKRSVLAILQSVPRLCGWCRTRWSCATIAVELYTRRKIAVSAETMRRWLHEVDWEWKRAKLSAKDDDPARVEKLARIRCAFEQLRAGAALFFADELDIHLLPKVGYQWMPKGTQVEVLTPGTNEKRYLGGALDLTTGTIVLKDEEDNPLASFFFTAYTKDGADPAKRPVTYTFNGGPGSSSVWLHMGAFGPKRVAYGDDTGHAAAPPYRLVDNEDSILDVTDLVFIDPITTGFSRAIPLKDDTRYHGVNADVQSVGEFIRLWTSRFNLSRSSTM